jgi:hypothetical protein
MARPQPAAAKSASPRRTIGIVDVAARRHREQRDVEGDEVELQLVDLGRTAVRRCATVGLDRRAILVEEERRRDADVADESARRLLLDGRRVGLPAEASDHRRPAARVPHEFGRPEMPSPSASSGSARASSVASSIAAIRPSPKTAGATRTDVSVSGASGRSELVDRRGRRAQAVRLAVGVRPGTLLVLEARAAFGRDAETARSPSCRP